MMHTSLDDQPLYLILFFSCSGDHRHLHSFPTRRSSDLEGGLSSQRAKFTDGLLPARRKIPPSQRLSPLTASASLRSEEHTSELQSPDHLVCRLLLEKKKLSVERDEDGAARFALHSGAQR